MSKKIDDMSLEEISRWCALLKAVDIIAENCESLGKKFDEIELKPIAIKHYINSLSNNIQKGMEEEIKNSNKKHKTSNKTINSLFKKNIMTFCEGNDVLQDKTL